MAPMSGLRVMVYPYPDHIVWSLMRINFHGVTTRQGRLGSGSIKMTPEALNGLTARTMMEAVLAALPPAAGSGSPAGDMGASESLNLALRE
jgi:hypothetical protein